MNINYRYLLLVVLVIVASAAIGIFLLFNREFAPQGEDFKRIIKTAHVYKDPSKPIAAVALKVFYVVPKNKAGAIKAGWQNSFRSALDKMAAFHQVQFHGLSKIKYDIFPEPVILENSNFFYDTEITDRGNPKALVAIAEEIERRVFQKNGDLYDANFSARDQNVYPVMGLIYEGVGASGGIIYESELESAAEIAKRLGVPEDIIYKVNIESSDGFFLLSRSFLTEEQHKNIGSTILYHEFGHTIGFPDQYDEETNTPFSNDVMGGGRRQPLEISYISGELLKETGVITNK